MVLSFHTISSLRLPDSFLFVWDDSLSQLVMCWIPLETNHVRSVFCTERNGRVSRYEIVTARLPNCELLVWSFNSLFQIASNDLGNWGTICSFEVVTSSLFDGISIYGYTYIYDLCISFPNVYLHISKTLHLGVRFSEWVKAATAGVINRAQASNLTNKHIIQDSV